MVPRLLCLTAFVLCNSMSVFAAEPPEGFTALFNGKDFTGWHGRPHYDPRKLAAMPDEEKAKTIDGWREDTFAHWSIDGDEIVNDGKGPYLTTDQRFGDFDFLIEYKTVAKADSGIYLRGNPQIQIWDFTQRGGKWNRAADKGSGGLFNNYKRSPGQEPLVLADKPFGEWNSFRIRQVGSRTDVWLNGKLVVDHELMENYWDRAKPQFRDGVIQLQTHGGEIRWRNLFIKEIGSPEANEILRTPRGTVLANLSSSLEAEFKRTPIQELIQFVAQASGSAGAIDGNALKELGLTRNIPLTFTTKGTCLDALRTVVGSFNQVGPPQLCVVVDEPANRFVLTSVTAAKKAGQTPHDLSPLVDSGWVEVFNGKNFDGWQGDVDNYEIVEGAVRCKAGKGGNLFSKDEYADFEVQLEFQLPPGGNNGLAIRFPGEGMPHVDGMCELQVLDSEHEKYAKLDARQYHGSAYGMAPATRGFLRPTGEWNFQHVKVQGSKIQVELNGNRILDADLSKATDFMGGSEHPGLKLKSGYFGFAGHNDPVAFRSIRIRRIDPSVEWNRTSWPQFRGHNGNSLALESTARLPTKIGPEEGFVWKTALPAGHSSPVIAGGKIFLTAVREGKLVTFCLDQKTGMILWENTAPLRELEEIHSIGSYAQCSPVTDGKVVLSLFGSSGLYCYDVNGKELWNVPMGPFVNEFGAGNSPLLVDGKVIVVQDHDADSFIQAFDVKTGDSVWKTDRSEFPRNYCSPVVWKYDGRKHLVVAATLRTVGYDAENGKEVWTVQGLSRSVCTTPVVGSDNNLYVAGWAAGGDTDSRIVLPEWGTAVSQWDKDDSGTIEKEELPDGPIKPRFPQFDRDRTNKITQAEYTWYRSVFEKAENRIFCVKPGGKGDISTSHVTWQFRRYLPFCSSPLFVNGYVFTVKNGGIVTSLNAATGEDLKTARVEGTGNYYASAVAGDNKIYLADQKGVVSVISSFAEWTELHTVEFKDEIYATPAIVDGKIYLRTNGHLFCFGSK